MRVTNLQEYVQVVEFIRKGEEILARANAEAKELAGEDDLLDITGLRQKIEASRKQKVAFEEVERFRVQGIHQLSEVRSLLWDLRLMYELDGEEMPRRFWQLEVGGLDEELSKHGIRLTASVDLTDFEKWHQMPQAAETAATSVGTRAQRPRRSSS